MTTDFFTKTITYQADGSNQLGEMIGSPVGDDCAKVHVEGYYMEYNVPVFRVGSWAFFNRKQVKVDFFDTHRVGETAFVALDMPSPPGHKMTTSPTLSQILTEAVRTMTLGESATISFTTSEKGISDMSLKGQFHTVPPNKEVTLQMDLFRLVRDKKEHRRPARNGTGGASMRFGGMG